VASQPHIHKHFSRLQVPLALVLIPTFQCHTNCIYCYSQRPDLPASEVLPAKRWVELLTEAGEFGLDLLGFSGGDPLAYPAIEELLEVARRYRMYCMIPTKTLVTRERAQRLAALLIRNDAVQVSVDSFDPEIAAAMTQTAGYAARARETIRNMVAAGIKLRTNTVVTPINYSSVEPLVRELHALGVRRANITNYSHTHYRHDPSLFLSEGQHEELQQCVLRVSAELDWPGLRCNAVSLDYSKPGSKRTSETWPERAHCSGGTSSMVILPNGDVVLCEQMPDADPYVVGNVRHHSLLEVWNSDRIREFVVPPREKFGDAPCRDCGEFDSCHRVYGRCFRDALFNYGTMFAPNPMCPQAPPGIRMA
jgi:radical SAM protein with 4Fe4S-binding SPASM domain